jgi:hypothetical protein
MRDGNMTIQVKEGEPAFTGETPSSLTPEAAASMGADLHAAA